MSLTTEIGSCVNLTNFIKKEEIRKIFFKPKLKGHSYNQYGKILMIKYNY